MTIEFGYTRDAAYLRRLARPAIRARVWALAWFVAALLGIAVLCFLTGDGRAVGAGLLSCALAVMTVQQSLDSRRVLRDMPAHLLEPTEFAITDDSVATSSASVAGRRAWSTFTRATESPTAYLLWNSRRQYVDVPRSPLTNEQDEQLPSFLIASRLLRPRNGAPLPEPAH